MTTSKPNPFEDAADGQYVAAPKAGAIDPSLFTPVKNPRKRQKERTK
jgi:hypothetical protein